MNLRNDILGKILGHHLNEQLVVREVSPIGGGCIHHAQKITTDRGFFFFKQNNSRDLDMFRTEFQGLQLLAEAGELDVPVPIAYGLEGDMAYLLVRFIESSRRNDNFWTQFGRSLANLHKNHQNDRYGLSFDNYIGRLHQYNDFHEDWISFFIEQRLEIQLKLARDNGYIGREDIERFHKFFHKLPGLLSSEPASLLHGDLWSGNFMTGEQGQAVIIDPAVYYGNREIELSFTRMFGGFDPQFYKAYQEIFPVEPGFEDRIGIYNIYPHLVHVNMFGASYLSGVTGVVRRYV